MYPVFTTRYNLMSYSEKLSAYKDSDLKELFYQAYLGRTVKNFISHIDPYSLTQEDIQGLTDIALQEFIEHLWREEALDGFELRRRIRAGNHNLTLFIGETAEYLLTDARFIHSLRSIVAVECAYGNLFITHDRRYELENGTF